MKRRDLLKSAGLVVAQQALRGLPAPKIKDIGVIATAPAGLRLVVVKVTTDQAGLFGYGCATFTQRADLVVPAVEKYLKPLLLGKSADRIDDIWQACYNSSYWRNGPVLNNAISGIDMALWDIKGRQANMPVYELLGGKVREGADCYTHASGAEISQTLDSARAILDRGFRYVRVQVGVPGMAGYGAARTGGPPVFEAAPYMRRALQLFEACRKDLPEDVELLHDVHERVHPIQAVRFAKDVEQFRLFFLEDVLSPEDVDYFKLIRQQSATQLAMGELFDNPHEWIPLISGRLIDFIRIHPSMIGGLTPARKVAALAEAFNVRSAWHGPGDLSPIGACCNITLDVTIPNFGVQEHTPFNERVQEVFQGCPVIKNGYWYPNDAPGWGIEVNETAAAKYPYGSFEQGERKDLNGGWGEVRRRDGSIIKQ
jgi:mannonate dehydratase